MNWQKIANIAGPRGADGVDGETPDIEWQGTALSVNGEVGPDLRGPQGTPGDPGKDSTVPGPPGERGAPGPAPAIKIGTVASGTTPSATITGTSPDLTLGLVLPKGDRGDRGETGPPGVVSSASSYVIVGPGRPDVPSTTAGTITGAEPVGARYESVDEAGVGARTWRKVAGGRWIVTDGDTGWRNIYADYSQNLSGNGPVLQVRRVNDVVSIVGGRLTIPTGKTSITKPMPAGFRQVSSQNVYDGVHSDAQPGWLGRVTIRESLYHIESNLPGAVSWSGFKISFSTPDTWPTVLPGSPT